MNIVSLILVTLVLGVMYASVFEWFFHRYIMHRPVRMFEYPYQAHTKTHHRIFRADYSYHLQLKEEGGMEDDKGKIRMAWWNGPILIMLGTLPFALSSVPFFFFDWLAGSIAILTTGIVLSACYYTAYEYLHWCMHLPKNRHVEHSWVFFKLNGHHLLHHRFMGKNFNVVFPFADWIFGTLLLRSPIKFAQVRGPSVPDVQPIKLANV